jgi:hypothetical protein
VTHPRLWKDSVKLMHIPLPFCVLAFATIGASFAQRVYLDRLALTYIGISLPLCLTAYSLDELHGRPYRTHFADRTLLIAATLGIAGGGVVGIYLALVVSSYILILVLLACFFVFAYNSELFGGTFHNAACFGFSWGGLSTFGGFFVQSQTVTASSLLVSVMASLLSVSILYLTHRFRPEELSKKLGEQIPEAHLREYSRHARRIAWSIARIECYSVILLAAALIAPKIFM